MRNKTLNETSDDRKHIGDTRGNSSKQDAKDMSRTNETWQ